ncbi:hypothetical protein TNCV_5069921 [Trichonephila clavipes]|nr:hypothetical protein TNCV_5069921 [Trichonephila clavipes]
MASQLCNHKAMVLHKLNKIIIDEGQSPTTLLIMGTLTNFGKLPTAAEHHMLTHDVWSINLTMNFNWHNALCIQELYHRLNLAGGGRRNKSFHFGPLLPRYWHEAGPVQLEYDRYIIDL